MRHSSREPQGVSLLFSFLFRSSDFKSMSWQNSTPHREPVSSDSDMGPTLAVPPSRQPDSIESPPAHPLSFRERILNRERRISRDNILQNDNDTGECWFSDMPSGQSHSEWPAYREQLMRMEDEEEEDIFDFEDAQRCTPVRREHASGMVTPPSIRYNRLRPQQQLSMTPHPPPSNPESFGPSSPYFSDEDVAPQSLSPPPPSTPPPYSFYKPNQKATFFSLPLELRQQIYNLILGSQASVEIHKLSSDGTPPAQSGFRSPISTLLCICRRISEEASDILYNNTHFSLDLSEDENGLSHFSVGNLERMRKLQLLVFPREEYPMPVWLDPKLWNPVLSNLKSLTVVVQEPLDFEKPDKELSWKEAEQWRRWAGPILKYIDTRLPAEVEVEIDDDSRHITKALVDKNFKNHRIKRVETRPGDWLFIRGEVKKLHEEDECSVM